MSEISVTWLAQDGSSTAAQVPEGKTMMQAAVDNGVVGIIGECGGGLMCATCHVYVSEEWCDAVGGMKPIEDDLLDMAEAERRPQSRLSCQIIASPALDGLVLQVP